MAKAACRSAGTVPRGMALEGGIEKGSWLEQSDKRKKIEMSFLYTLWLFNIAMENGPFIDGLPIKTSISRGFSMAMLNNQRVCV